jgi:hypothetical protein
MTLLEIVQSVLSSISSDSVNNITDTVESYDIACVARDCYADLITQRDDWPFMQSMTQLTAMSDLDNPTKMKIPDTMASVQWIKYNKQDVTYKTPKEFKDLLDGRTAQTGIIDSNGYVLNRDPQYWTTYDDTYIYFDGYNSNVDSTLQASKSVVMGQNNYTWTMDNNFEPVLPTKMIPAYLAEVKAEAFVSVKQQTNQRQERKAKRGRDRWQKDARRAKDSEQSTNGVNYGRK